MKKTLSRIFAVLLVVSLVFTQLLIPATAAEVKNCTCTDDVSTREGTKVGVSVAATCTTPAYDTLKCKTCGGLFAKFTAPANGHDEVTHAAKAPTCTEIGWEEYVTCNVCDYTTYKPLSVIEHSWEDVPAEDATCTEIGCNDHKVCSVCGAIDGYEPVDKIPHIEGDVVVENVVPAGCETPATEEHVVYCTVCNEELSRETVETAPAHGHNYLLIDSKPAICMQADGMNVYSCEYCRDVKREIIAMPEEHDYKLKEAVIDCVNGDTEVHECKVCGFTVTKKVPALGHDWKAATCYEPKTCKRCDEPEGNPLPHTYKKYTEGTNKGKEIVTVIAPTCSAEGYSTKYCTRCKKDIEVEGSRTAKEPLNHKSVITIEKVEPTCTEVGYTPEMKCAYCDLVTVSVTEIPALGHTWGNESKVSMNCTRDGYTFKTCKTCRTVDKYDIIPACGHDLDPTVGHKAPTCEVQGYDFQACLCEFNGVRCSYEDKSNFVPALGHDWSEWTMVDDTTHTRICQYAECEVDGGKVEYADHNIVEHDAKAPTCTEIGWDAYVTCSDCEYTTYVEKSAHGHRLERWIAQEATCTQDGWSDHIECAICDYATPHSFTPALGHQIMNVPDKAPSCFEPGWTKHTECARCGETSLYFEFAPIGEHDVVVDEAIQPTYDETGLTEGSHCGRCGEILVAQVVIDRIREEVSFTYEAVGINGSDTVVNSGYVYVNIYLNVLSTKARVWAVDLNMLYNSNFTLESVDGCILETTSYNDIDAANAAGDILIAQDMGFGDAKEFEEGSYLFATLKFKVNKAFYNDSALFEIVEENCLAARDFENELIVDFGDGVTVDVAMLGDANNDGKINSNDTMAFSKWFVEAEENEYEAIYDLNKDGKINGDDFALLRGAVVRDDSYLDL